MQALIPLIIRYKYAILVPLAAVEGPVLALVIGFLIHLGILSFFGAYVVLVIGDFIPDSIYYYIGRFGMQKEFLTKHRKRFSFVADHLEMIEKLWQEHSAKAMFFAKLAAGLSPALLVTAGLSKISYRKFIAYAVPVTLFQYTVILFLGYYLGGSYQEAVKYFKYAGWAVAAIVVVFIIAYQLVLKFARNKLLKMDEAKAD